MLRCIIMTVLGFISGSLMFSYFIPRWFLKVDIRKAEGDGNPGSTNAIKAAGLPVGLLCMALDLLKGFIPVFVAVFFLDLSGYYLLPVLIAPTVGHAFSPFLSFNGGKALAVSYGTLLGAVSITWAVFVVALMMVLFKFIIIIKPDSAKVITSLVAAYAVILLFEPLPEIKIAAGGIFFIISLKTFINPDKGIITVSIWHYELTIDEFKIRFKRV